MYFLLENNTNAYSFVVTNILQLNYTFLRYNFTILYMII